MIGPVSFQDKIPNRVILTNKPTHCRFNPVSAVVKLAMAGQTEDCGNQPDARMSKTAGKTSRWLKPAAKR
jgi:hypothetical protein